MTGVGHIDAERAFTRARRSRRRAAFGRWLRHAGGGQLPVHHEETLGRSGGLPRGGVQEVPLDAIQGTLEPNRATQFDSSFRPAASVQRRWQSVWLAAQRGVALPPIALVAIGDGYAVRDGHHRVSVARARGALAIDATVDRATRGRGK